MGTELVGRVHVWGGGAVSHSDLNGGRECQPHSELEETATTSSGPIDTVLTRLYSPHIFVAVGAGAPGEEPPGGEGVSSSSLMSLLPLEVAELITRMKDELKDSSNEIAELETQQDALSSLLTNADRHARDLRLQLAKYRRDMTTQSSGGFQGGRGGRESVCGGGR